MGIMPYMGARAHCTPAVPALAASQTRGAHGELSRTGRRRGGLQPDTIPRAPVQPLAGVSATPTASRNFMTHIS